MNFKNTLLFPNNVSRVFGLSQKLKEAAHARPLFIYVPDLKSAYDLKDNLLYFDLETKIHVLPPLETDLLRNRGPSIARKVERIRAFHAIAHSNADLIIVPPESFFQVSPNSVFWKKNSIDIKKGDALSRTLLMNQLGGLGYQPTELVEQAFQYSVRGSIVDAFCPLYDYPLRFELFEDEVQSIRFFYPDSQRKIEDLESATLVPAHEFLWPSLEQSQPQGLKSYVRQKLDLWEWDKPDRDALLARIEQKSFFHTIDFWGPLIQKHSGEALTFEFPEPFCVFDSLSLDKEIRTTGGALNARFLNARLENEWVPAPDEFFASPTGFLFNNSDCYNVNPGANENYQGLDSLSYKVRSESLDQRSIPVESFVNNLRPFFEKGTQIIFSAFTQGSLDRLNFLMSSFHWVFKKYDSFQEARASKSPLVSVVGGLEEGFIDSKENFIVIPETFIFDTKKKLSRNRNTRSLSGSETKQFLSSDVFLLSLSPGDHVVHKEHGIGKYLGLKSLSVGGITTEFIEIEYKETNKLLVPITKLGLIQRHSGQSESVSLDRLGGQTWSAKKAKVKKELQSIAGELLNLYSIRALAKGPEIKPSDDAVAKFAATFVYQETPDQTKAIDDTLKDLRGPKPMDRLICGDVGYGKTEIAIRAAHAAVEAGFQVAVLVPTTLLATQHENQFRKRFSPLGIEVAGFSRFKTSAEIKESLEKLKNGRVKIAIGTHKLLGQSVVFSNLGLLIIDEEQKFGVAHKEKLKRFRSNIHVLSMTATPIPRTLNFAMSGLRELSIISTPPQNRMSVRTFVSRKKEALIREAISNELHRGGQVFYVHNRVQTIDREVAFVAPLCPAGATLDFAHGQMDEEILEKKMIDFYEGRTQILIATSIIESGLDVPNANTLIVDRADAFGLSQLYQIRGRVGRSDVRGYAYFLIPDKTPITDDAEERLRVLESYQELGSGFHIASHDLDLRGAGEFLGREQSGNMSALGYDAFIDLLNECVAELKGEEVQATFDPEVNLGIDISIPETYIKDIGLRLMFYRKLSSLSDENDIPAVLEELSDRFGDPPSSVESLIIAMRIKSRLRNLGIRSIHSGAGGFSLSFDASTRIAPKKMVQAVQKYPAHFQMNPDGRLLIRNVSKDSSQVKILAHIETMLDEIGTWMEQ